MRARRQGTAAERMWHIQNCRGVSDSRLLAIMALLRLLTSHNRQHYWTIVNCDHGPSSRFSSPLRCRAKRGQLETFKKLVPSSPGHYRALIVFCMPTLGAAAEEVLDVLDLYRRIFSGTSLIRNCPLLLGPPQGPRYSLTVGS